MRRVVVFACVLSAAGFAPAPFPKPNRAKADSEQADLAAMQGTWQVRLLCHDDRQIDRKGWRVVVSGSQMKYVSPGQDDLMEYVITLNARARPKTVDLTIALRSGRKMILRGTYSFRGMELLLCCPLAFNDPRRPSDCGPGPSRTFEILERVSDSQ